MCETQAMKRTGPSTEHCQHCINTAYREMNVVRVCLMSWMCPDKYERSQSSTQNDLIFYATGRCFDILIIIIKIIIHFIHS